MTLSTKQKQILLIVASGVLSTVATALSEAYPQYRAPIDQLLVFTGIMLGLPLKLPSGKPAEPVATVSTVTVEVP